MITPGDVGGGLGTASSVCTISPADNEAIINNLIARIEKLEFDLSQVLGANLHSNTLGDLSSQVGWVYGVEYMGVPGWIQTEYGTLIPPPGFTLSGSGMQLYNSCTGEFEDYQAVVMDSDGVLRWGATAAGNLCGTKVEEWDNAASTIGNTHFASLEPSYTASNGITVVSNNMGTSYATSEITIAEAGYYRICGQSKASYGNIIGSPGWSYFLSIPKNGVSFLGDSGVAGPHDEAEVSTVRLSVNSIHQLAAGDTLEFSTQSPTVGVESILNKSFNVLKVAPI